MITERGNVKYSEKICSTAKLSTTYPTHNNLEINLDFCGQSQQSAWDMAWTTVELKHENDQSPPIGVEVTNEQCLISLTFPITSVFQCKSKALRTFLRSRQCSWYSWTVQGLNPGPGKGLSPLHTHPDQPGAQQASRTINHTALCQG